MYHSNDWKKPGDSGVVKVKINWRHKFQTKETRFSSYIFNHNFYGVIAWSQCSSSQRNGVKNDEEGVKGFFFQKEFNTLYMQN